MVIATSNKINADTCCNAGGMARMTLSNSRFMARKAKGAIQPCSSRACNSPGETQPDRAELGAMLAGSLPKLQFDWTSRPLNLIGAWTNQISLTIGILIVTLASHAAELRLVGTNLYDFSAAHKKFYNCAYRIHGRVVKTYPQSIMVAVPRPGANLFYYSDTDLADARLEGTRYYRQVLDSTHKSSRMDIIAETLHGSESARELRNDAIAESAWQGWEKTLKKDEAYIYILNSPPTSRGKEFDSLAVPTTNGFFDCGIPFSGNPTNYSRIFVLQTNRVTVITNTP